MVSSDIESVDEDSPVLPVLARGTVVVKERVPWIPFHYKGPLQELRARHGVCTVFLPLVDGRYELAGQLDRYVVPGVHHLVVDQDVPLPDPLPLVECMRNTEVC